MTDVDAPTVRLLGPQEVADLLGCHRDTIRVWRRRRILPEPATHISGMPVWQRETIVGWAKETGRWPG